MASKPTVNMDSASSQSESHTESSYSHDSSHVSQQSSSTQNAPSNRNYLNYLSALFVWPPLVEGPLYGMSEEQHAIMLKKAECKLPTTPPPNTKDEDVQDVTSPSISPKPFRFSGFTSNDTGSGSLCQLHILEDNAFFAVDSPEIRKIQDNFLSGDYEQLPSLMKTSLAAVALRIGIPGQPHASRVSGFRLGRDTIITCAQFATWPETEQGFMDAARMFHSGMNGVNEALQVREITTPTAALRNRFKIRLSAVLVDRDIAVFHILERPRTDHWNPVVDPSQMVFTAEHSRVELRKTQLCWSVGYNISVNQEEFNDTWSDFFHSQSSEKQSDIVLAHGYTEDRPPSLEELKPSRRTVAFGKFRENPDEHGLKLEPHQEYIDHTAWHGRSGGMVCVYDGGNKKAWVCGIVIGGFRIHDFNHMNVFTSDVEEWMARAISFQDVTSTPAEFGRRFIRSL